MAGGTEPFALPSGNDNGLPDILCHEMPPGMVLASCRQRLREDDVIPMLRSIWSHCVIICCMSADIAMPGRIC